MVAARESHSSLRLPPRVDVCSHSTSLDEEEKHPMHCRWTQTVERAVIYRQNK